LGVFYVDWICKLTMAMGDIEVDYGKLCGELELQEQGVG